MSEVERKRSAKKLFERACKLERGYNYLFTDVIRLDEDDWLLKVHTTISDQQNGLVWVSEKVGSACEDDDSEYDEHNDDRNVFLLFVFFFVPMELLPQYQCNFLRPMNMKELILFFLTIPKLSILTLIKS